ncbi:antitoxin Xre/MbcA/ParS toxin-binding domain-containing protein [Pseudomonas mohnii]
MIADAIHKTAYCDYRIELALLLRISSNASDQDIHEQIEAGLLAESVVALCDIGAIGPAQRNQLIPLKTLKARLATRQRLTLHESNRVFRFAHIIALAVTLFRSHEKAKRWLSKPQKRLMEQAPFAMLSTYSGTRLVEELLIQVAEGITC